MKRPKAVRSYSCHIDNISLVLRPSLQAFEDQLLARLNEDRRRTESLSPDTDQTQIKIEKRYLQVALNLILYPDSTLLVVMSCDL